MKHDSHKDESLQRFKPMYTPALYSCRAIHKLGSCLTHTRSTHNPDVVPNVVGDPACSALLAVLIFPVFASMSIIIDVSSRLLVPVVTFHILLLVIFVILFRFRKFTHRVHEWHGTGRFVQEVSTEFRLGTIWVCAEALLLG